ncbi:MAG: DUF5671 domain-containing protein [Candidatus Pacebacteria bacterium]|jgi:cytochrome b|nr:DUF5671 domain-containing protein [Candidatus Paceibacterota bacterium]
MQTTQNNNFSVTPKDFFFWAGAMVAFYATVIALVNLVFNYINYLFPNALNTYQVDPYQSGISSQMATIIIAVPVFVLLMRLIRGTIALDPTRQEIWVRRWAIVLTLFVSGAAMIVSLIVLLTTFLNGEELTARFLLKVLTMLIVAGSAFGYFFADIKGYWSKSPSCARNVGYAFSFVLALTVIAGFFIVGTPREARLARYDAQKVSDLQGIQWQIVSYYQQKEKLPKTLVELVDPISGTALSTDPQSKVEYEYAPKAGLSFELCANFNAESRKKMDGGEVARPMYSTMDMMKGDSADSWTHAAGRVCFERTIDPDRYPPLKK